MFRFLLFLLGWIGLSLLVWPFLRAVLHEERRWLAGRAAWYAVVSRERKA